MDVTTKLLLILLAVACMAPMCEDDAPKPCIRRTHPDDPMGTFLYPDDCPPPSADGVDAGVGR